jgi:hypothetical protein
MGSSLTCFMPKVVHKDDFSQNETSNLAFTLRVAQMMHFKMKVSLRWPLSYISWHLSSQTHLTKKLFSHQTVCRTA